MNTIKIICCSTAVIIFCIVIGTILTLLDLISVIFTSKSLFHNLDIRGY